MASRFKTDQMTRYRSAEKLREYRIGSAGLLAIKSEKLPESDQILVNIHDQPL